MSACRQSIGESAYECNEQTALCTTQLIEVHFHRHRAPSTTQRGGSGAWHEGGVVVQFTTRVPAANQVMPAAPYACSGLLLRHLRPLDFSVLVSSSPPQAINTCLGQQCTRVTPPPTLPAPRSHTCSLDLCTPTRVCVRGCVCVRVCVRVCVCVYVYVCTTTAHATASMEWYWHVYKPASPLHGCGCSELPLAFLAQWSCPSVASLACFHGLWCRLKHTTARPHTNPVNHIMPSSLRLERWLIRIRCVG